MEIITQVVFLYSWVFYAWWCVEPDQWKKFQFSS